MPLGSYDGETSGGLDLRGKLDIGSSTGHVGGYGDGTGHTCLGHDLGLLVMELSVEDIVLDASHIEHSAQKFRRLHVGGTDQYWTALFHQFLDLVYDGGELGLSCLVDQVILVIPDDGTVGGDYHHIQLVDAPELTRLGLCGTGHAGELVVHPEVVLQGDSGVSLRRSLDLDVLLGLHCLVQSVGPAPSLHDTARSLIDNLYLVVHDDVVNVFLEHGVCLEELDHCVDPLALEGEVLHEGVLALALLLGGQVGSLYLGNLGPHVGEDEEVVVIDHPGKGVMTLVGEVHGVLLLVYDEVQGIRDHRHLPLIVLEIVVLSLLLELLHSGLGEVLDEGIVFGKTLDAAVQELSSLGLVT